MKERTIMNRPVSIKTLLLLTGVIFSASSQAQTIFDFEGGYVSTGYNDVAIPGDSGDEFSLTDDFEAEANGAVRIRLSHTFSERHWWAILAAPLTMKSSGVLDKNLNFNGDTFLAESPIDATFRFDSYRFIYRYRIHQSDSWQFSFGGALKIRDAAITLTNGDVESSKTNTGVVPLLSFNLAWTPTEKLNLFMDGEALAAPQGRAEDVLFGIKYNFTDEFSLKTGYRVLEGGADNDEVYTFSLFNYFVAGVVWTL